MAHSIPFNMLGLSLSGDVGDFTLYTDKFHRIIAFPRSPPKVPASPRQLFCRQRWRNACDTWNEQPPEIKAKWELLTLRANMCMTGNGLWMKMSLNPDYVTFERLSLQYLGEVLDRPPWFPNNPPE